MQRDTGALGISSKTRKHHPSYHSNHAFHFFFVCCPNRPRVCVCACVPLQSLALVVCQDIYSWQPFASATCAVLELFIQLSWFKAASKQAYQSTELLLRVPLERLVFCFRRHQDKRGESQERRFSQTAENERMYTWGWEYMFWRWFNRRVGPLGRVVCLASVLFLSVCGDPHGRRSAVATLQRDSRPS